MDKRSIIGYILIGLVLVFYFYYNQPSEEQIQAQKEYAAAQKREALKKDSISMAEETMKMAMVNDRNNFFYNVLRGENRNVAIENGKIKAEISTYGGRVASVTIKDYNSQDGSI